MQRTEREARKGSWKGKKKEGKPESEGRLRRRAKRESRLSVGRGQGQKVHTSSMLQESSLKVEMSWDIEFCSPSFQGSAMKD